MKRQYSISLRLTFWFSAAFLLGFVLFGAALYADLAFSLGAGRDKTLTTRVRRLRELLEISHTDLPERRVAKFANFVEGTPEGRLIQVFDLSGVRVYPPPSWVAVPFPWPRGPDAERHFSKTWYRGQQYRVMSDVFAVPPDTYRVFIAGQLTDNRTILSRFARALLLATPALLALSALGGYFLSRRALNPVARLTASARSIAIGNLQRRLPISHTGDELQQLAETCNEMLARVENAVNQIIRFTADASHELRSPITYIRTVSEYALRNPHLEEEVAESFREIVRESEEATRLLEDMLTLARADAGHAGIPLVPVDLAQVVSDTYRRAQPMAEARHHALSLDSNAKGEVRIAADEPSLKRLLWILVDNAIRYTPEGGQVRLALQTSGGEARVSVCDSGPGIPQTAQAHIFDRFYRADRNRGTEDGTGLGLAIAKWIAEVHNVMLSVKSSAESGSTFEICFRLAGQSD